MKQCPGVFKTMVVCISLFLIAGCTNGGAVIDKNDEVENHNWTYVNKFQFDVNIDDPHSAYNIYTNVRVTGDYKYSNMFVLLTEVGPDKKSKTTRFELTLADKDGAWLGEGSGNLYSYQIPVIKNYTFPAKGLYTFYIGQDMRDNPLREVSDVGLRVEKAKP